MQKVCVQKDLTFKFLCFSSKAAQTTKKWSAALQMVEEKARCLLSKPEFTSLCYYVDEYASRHMTIDAFVQVMTEVLNTSEKVSLLISKNIPILNRINIFSSTPL